MTIRSDDYWKRTKAALMNQLGKNICALLDDPAVIEIMLNDNGKVWVERLGEDMELVEKMAPAQAFALLKTIASSANKEITEENPILECELVLDGSRFEGVIPPVARSPMFTIRKRAIKVFTLEDYVKQGVMSEWQRKAIEKAVCDRKNILISGGTSSGKTTLTNAVIQYMVDVFPKDRPAILEDTWELQCTAENYVLLRAVEQAQMPKLLTTTLRMRPDRILVGEVRDGAAHSLLKAWNTGHKGGVATVHANDALLTLSKMEQLMAESPEAPRPPFMQAVIAEAVDLIVSIEKCEGSRRIREIVRVLGHDGSKYLTEIVDNFSGETNDTES